VAGNGTAEVRCVVRIARSSSKALLGFPGGLTITGKHPVRIAGRWVLPSQMCQDLEQVPNPSGFVYNFVLEQCHIVLVNGVECVTWGHGIDEDVVRHSYYGTNDVISDISKLPGWDEGFVTVGGCLRDASGQVKGLRG